MLSFAQLVKEWRSKTYEYLPHFFKLQARERLLIHRNNICIIKKLRLMQVSVSTSLHRLSSRLPREFSLAFSPTISSSSFWVKEAQTSRNTAFNSSRVFRWTCCTRVFIFCQTNSMMLRSGELHGHSKTSILFSFRYLGVL